MIWRSKLRQTSSPVDKVRQGKTMGTYGSGIPPTHPAKANHGRENRPVASKHLFKCSSCFLNLRTRLFCNLPFRRRIFQILSFIKPPKHPPGTYDIEQELSRSEHVCLIDGCIPFYRLTHYLHKRNEFSLRRNIIVPSLVDTNTILVILRNNYDDTE